MQRSHVLSEEPLHRNLTEYFWILGAFITVWFSTHSTHQAPLSTLHLKMNPSLCWGPGRREVKQSLVLEKRVTSALTKFAVILHKNDGNAEILLTDSKWRYVSIFHFLFLNHGRYPWICFFLYGCDVPLATCGTLTPKAKAAVFILICFLQSCKCSSMLTDFSLHRPYSWTTTEMHKQTFKKAVLLGWPPLAVWWICLHLIPFQAPPQCMQLLCVHNFSKLPQIQRLSWSQQPQTCQWSSPSPSPPSPPYICEVSSHSHPSSTFSLTQSFFMLSWFIH